MLCFITVSKFIIFVTTYINIVIINGYKYNYVTMNDDANFTLRADQRKFFRNLTSIVKLETKDIVNWCRGHWTTDIASGFAKKYKRN